MGLRAFVRGYRQGPVEAYRRDDFLTWVSFITPGMLTFGNIALLNHAIQNMPDEGAVIEIGSFAGLSLNHILHMMQQSGRSNPVFSIDEWQFEGSAKGAIPGSTVSFADYRAHVIETFRRNLELFHAERLPQHIVKSSDDFFALWAARERVTDFFDRSAQLGGGIAVAYIDGDHTHAQSRRDFENVDRHLVPGGYIIFDDSADNSEWGSRLTAVEAAARSNYELVAKNPNYCVRKRA